MSPRPGDGYRAGRSHRRAPRFPAGPAAGEQFTTDELARVAYSAYGRSTGWLTHDGRPMPEWPNLTDVTRTAWRAAAAAVTRLTGHPS